MDMNKLRVLVVDDNASDRMVTAAALKSLNVAAVQEAESIGRAKFKLATAHKIKQNFDLVICDWEMPNGDGILLLQHLRKDERYEGMGLMIMTGSGEPSRVAEAIKNQANDFILKPIQLEKLQQKLEGFLRKSKDR